jgi:O-antigen/teichoic acid export membrane protein
MGIFANYSAIVAILGVVSAGSYELAIVLPENDNDAVVVAILGVIIAILFGLVITAVLFFFAVPLGYFFKLQEIPQGWLYCIGFIVTLIGIDAVLNKLIVRNRRFSILAFSQIIQQFTINGIKIGSPFLGMESGGLYIASISGYFIRVVQLLLSIKNELLASKKILSFARIKEVAKRYRKFPFVNTWSVLLNTASIQLPIIVITNMFSAVVTGYYSLSHRILSLPMTLIGQAVAQVFFDRAAKAKNDPVELAQITLSIYKKLLILGSLTMSVVTFYGDIIFPFVFGAEWAMAGRYAQWLSIWLVFTLCASPLSNIYFVMERQGEALIINTIIFISRIGVIVFAQLMMFSDINMIAFFSILGALLYNGVSFRILRLVRISVAEIFRSYFSIILIYIFQFFISVFVRKLFS